MQDQTQTQLRLFFSFHVPEDIGSRLRSSLDHIPHIAWYPAQNLHVTLKFIGEVDAKAIPILTKIASDIAAKTPVIRFQPHQLHPADDRLRLLITPNPELIKLYADFLRELARLPFKRIEPELYQPHITLGRLTNTTTEPIANIDIANLEFTADCFGLYKSEPGEHNTGAYALIESFPLRGTRQTVPEQYTTVILPTRSQPDTLVAIFILKKFGEARFPEIKGAAVDFWQTVPAGETEETLDQKGIILIDVGGGKFDHHASPVQTTASDLVARYVGVHEDPSLAKLLEYARRDDFFGKGTISEDPLDRAFGLSALIAALNKSLVKNPGRVVDIVMPFLVAHHNEEVRRTKELPLEFEEKRKRGEVHTFEIKQRDKKLRVVTVTSESGSLAGYLRSQQGGRFDVVAQWLPSGHVNILTRPTKRVDLRSLAALLRIEEATKSTQEIEMNMYDLAGKGRMKEIPEWYYDMATNSIQNGGLNPKDIPPTKISREEFIKILELGLSEKLWDPRTGATEIRET